MKPPRKMIGPGSDPTWLETNCPQLVRELEVASLLGASAAHGDDLSEESARKYVEDKWSRRRGATANQTQQLALPPGQAQTPCGDRYVGIDLAKGKDRTLINCLRCGALYPHPQVELPPHQWIIPVCPSCIEEEGEGGFAFIQAVAQFNCFMQRKLDERQFSALQATVSERETENRDLWTRYQNLLVRLDVADATEAQLRQAVTAVSRRLDDERAMYEFAAEQARRLKRQSNLLFAATVLFAAATIVLGVLLLFRF